MHKLIPKGDDVVPYLLHVAHGDEKPRPVAGSLLQRCLVSTLTGSCVHLQQSLHKNIAEHTRNVMIMSERVNID